MPVVEHPPTAIDPHYDAIVIGAGIGGLFAALFLVKSGARTLLIERHDVVGGYLQGGWRKGFYFDYGTQTNEIKGAILPALQELGLDDRVKFHQCHHRFLSSDGLELSLHDLEDARLAFTAAYPESSAGLNDYFSYFGRATDIARQLNENGIAGMMRSDCAHFMPDYNSYWNQQPYYDEMMDFDGTTSWKKTRQLLGPSRAARLLAHFGYRNQSALATGIFWHLWRDDYFYNEGGKQAFVDMLADAFVERGGTLALNSEVEEIVVQDDAVRGVRLANGRLVRAEGVISNADLRLTLERLLRGHPRIAGLLDRARDTPVSEAFFTVYLGTSIPIEELRQALHGAHNTWVFPTHNGLPDPFSVGFHAAVPMEISAAVLHDPRLAEAGSHVVLQAFSYCEWMDRWRVRGDGHHGIPYRSLKREVEEQLIDNAARVIPGLKERIIHRSSATPLTHLRYTLNQGGASAGWTWNPRRTMVTLKDQLITTPFRNLFFAGHWVLYPGGLLTATLAGKIAADVLVAGQTAINNHDHQKEQARVWSAG